MVHKQETARLVSARLDKTDRRTGHHRMCSHVLFSLFALRCYIIGNLAVVRTAGRAVEQPGSTVSKAWHKQWPICDECAS